MLLSKSPHLKETRQHNMLLTIYQPISLKPNNFMVIDAVELYILLILGCVSFTHFSATGVFESEKFCANCFTKFSINCDENLCHVKRCTLF